MYKYVKTNQDIYASSMSRILQHSSNIATLTSWITSSDEDRPTKKTEQTKKQNRESNKALSRDLQKLLYGFSKVSGYWDESGSGNKDNATLEETYLIIAPKGQPYETFEKTILALAKKYEQQGVLIWSYEEQKGYLWCTDDYENYEVVEEFSTLNIDKSIEYAWSRFRKNSFVFSSDDDVVSNFCVDSVTELSKAGGGCSPSYAAKAFRQKLIREFGD